MSGTDQRNSGNTGLQYERYGQNIVSGNAYGKETEKLKGAEQRSGCKTDGYGRIETK